MNPTVSAESQAMRLNSKGRPQVAARVAGISWLTTIVASFSADLGARRNLMLSGDAAATANSLVTSLGWYRVSIVLDLLAVVAYLIATVFVYDLLRPVNRRLSLLAASFSLVGIAVGALSEIGFIAPMVILGGPHYLNVFETSQLNAMAYFSITLYGQAFSLSILFFGCQLLALCYLFFTSRLIPRAIGVLVAIAGLCLLTDSVATVLAPELEKTLSNVLLPVDAIGEGALSLWLLVMGVNVARWEAIDVTS